MTMTANASASSCEGGAFVILTVGDHSAIGTTDISTDKTFKSGYDTILVDGSYWESD